MANPFLDLFPTEEAATNPFLDLFPTEEAAKNAKEARDRQHQGLQATLKRIFLITGESKWLVSPCLQHLSYHVTAGTEQTSGANTPRFLVHVTQFARSEAHEGRTGAITNENYDKVYYIC